MFQFNFSLTKTVARNTTSYPITLAEVKARSEYFRQNPSDTALDSYITSIVIPKIIFDWEKSTGYLLLDHTIQAFVPNLKSINTNMLNVGFQHLNIREFTNVKYYPENWNYSDSKTTLDSSYYFFVPESGNECAKFNLKENYIPLTLFDMLSNLEVNYKAGFGNNVFTSLNPSIVDALACQAALAVDAKTGYCQDFYSTIVAEVYSEYSINRQEIAII